jgi:hypothetical protein
MEALRGLRSSGVTTKVTTTGLPGAAQPDSAFCGLAPAGALRPPTGPYSRRHGERNG